MSIAHYKKTDRTGMTVMVNVKRQVPDMTLYKANWSMRRGK